MTPFRMSAFILFFAIVIFQVSGISDFYYWKEYTGEIPPDALPGGRDPDGRPAYIGEAYVHGHGLYTAQIYPGIQEVDMTVYGLKSATTNIKILCTDHPEYFHWIKTTAQTYEQDVENVEVVTAGYDTIANNGIMNIGRVFYQGFVMVGDVTPFQNTKGNIRHFFPFTKLEHSDHFYELLVVKTEM